MSAPAIHFVVPAGIADPAHPSGGNHYDRRVSTTLGDLGREVREHPVAEPSGLGGLLAGLPQDAVVLVDGLLASFAPQAVAAAAGRSTVVVLLHMPVAESSTDERVRRTERAALGAAAGVVTTSAWAGSWVVRHHGVPPDRVRVAAPGVDPADLTAPSATGDRLLCLAAVIRAKGHDVLFSALAQVADLDWSLTCAGTLEREPAFVAGLRETAVRSGIADRVHLAGPLTGERLRAALAQTDLLVSVSRHESYGMAVTEALACGVPVVVTDVGGHAEAVDGPVPVDRPGVLVPPEDPDRLADAVREWLSRPDRRERLRAASAARRAGLEPWTTTARHLAEAVDAFAGHSAARPAVPSGTTGAAR